MREIIVRICFIFSFASCALSNGNASPQMIVGVVAPLSGAFSSVGESIKNSVILASQKYDSDGRVKFLFEDDQMAPKNTVNAVTKLIEVDKVNALVVFGTPTSLAVNSIAESRQTPMVALSILDKVNAGKRFVFRHWVKAGILNDLILDGFKQRKYKNVAVVTTVNDAALDLRDRFRTSGIANILIDEEFDRQDVDFRAVIAKLRAKNPDSVYVLLWPPQLGIFVKQLREGGFSGDIFGYSNFEDPKEVEASGGKLVGGWYASGDDRNASAYYKDYEATYKAYPATGGANAYDVAKMLIEGSSAPNLTEHLHSLHDFSGTFGSYSSTGNNDFNLPAATKKVTAEGFEFISAPNSVPNSMK